MFNGLKISTWFEVFERLLQQLWPVLNTAVIQLKLVHDLLVQLVTYGHIQRSSVHGCNQNSLSHTFMFSRSHR